MSDTLTAAPRRAGSSTRRPRVGFLGVGWIGRNRMEAMLATGAIDPAGVVEPDGAMAEAALALAPRARRATSLGELLDLDLDGIVIATPSALHAAQCRQALAAGVAVFCQKPLGRSLSETREVVEMARARDLRLGVDFSYRHTTGMQRIRDLVQAAALGPVHAVDLTFHNAYGPDKPWFYDPALSGGGCVMDLGIHLVDLALWVLDFPQVRAVSAHLYAGGAPLEPGAGTVEDYAVATLELASGAVVRLACSWRLPAGCDAVIAAEFYGRDGGAAFRNVEGSFYDFTAARFSGTAREALAGPPDDWGGRAAADWAAGLATSRGYDPAADRLVEVAAVIDRLYRRG